MTGQSPGDPDGRAPLVSVILPACNAERFIGETLASILAQTWPNLEIVAVDDGSEDRTADIVREHAHRDPRVRLLRQANRGVAAARNHALEHSAGALIAPIDADDVWQPSKLERQVRALAAQPPVVGLAYAWSRRIDAEGRAIGPCAGDTCSGAVFLPLLLGNFIGNSSSPLIRRECFDRVGGYSTAFQERGAQGCEDWELYLRIAEAYRFLVVPECLVDYRRTADSMSADAARMERSYRVLLELVKARHPTLPDLVFRWSEAAYLLYVANTCSRSLAPEGALRYLRRSVALDPALLCNKRFLRLLVRSLAQLPGRSARPARARRTGVRASRSGFPASAPAGRLWNSVRERRRERLRELQRGLPLPVVSEERNRPPGAGGGMETGA